MSFGGNDLVIPTKSGSFLRMEHIDLQGITQLELTAMAPKAQLNAAGGTIELRIDSPTGQLVGKTDFIGDVPGAGFSAKASTLKVQPTEGFHDIFLVFQNPNAPVGQSLMVVTNVEFKTDAPATTQTPSSAESKVNLNDYSGKYTMTGLPFAFIEVSAKEGKLMMDAGGQIGELTPTDTPDKYDAGGRAIIYFVRDDAQKVKTLKMDAMGFSFEGKKE
jgi:cytochrome c